MGEPESANPNPPDDATRGRLLRKRTVIIQLIGFAVGIGLLYWIISGAIAHGDWSRLAEADRGLILGLLGFTAVSVVANGAIFWTVIRPVRPLKFMDLQMVNVTTAILNYAPIRLGLISRIAYHLRVDRMPLLQMGGWLAALAYVLALCLGASVVATLLRPEIDLVWAALLAGQLALGGLLTMAMMGHPIVTKYGRGMDQMLRTPGALWGGMILRLVDFAAFTGRMACAVAILQLPLTAGDVVLLALATLALTLNPLGRFGFREAGVALTAQLLVGAKLSAEGLQGEMEQLALIESAGEAIFTIPLGVIGLVWYRRRWRRARTTGDNHAAAQE